MNTIELTHVLDKLALNANFLGVVPCDWLTRVKFNARSKKPSFCVDRSHLKGSHWVCMFLPPWGTGAKAAFFDSFGRPPTAMPPEIARFLKKSSNGVAYLNKPVQSPLSLRCGEHCVFVIHALAHGRPYKSVLKLYSNNLSKNDDMVGGFTSYLKRCVTRPRTCNNVCNYNQSCVLQKRHNV